MFLQAVVDQKKTNFSGIDDKGEIETMISIVYLMQCGDVHSYRAGLGAT